jgi:hypothetical protein
MTTLSAISSGSHGTEDGRNSLKSNAHRPFIKDLINDTSFSQIHKGLSRHRERAEFAKKNLRISFFNEDLKVVTNEKGEAVGEVVTIIC